MKKKYIIIVTLMVIGTLMVLFFFYFKDREVRVQKEYNSSGKLTKTNEYIIRDGEIIVQGKFVNYNDEGVKITEGQFLNNEAIGIWNYYYDSSKLKTVYFRKNNEVDLEAVYYNTDGLISKYVMLDYIGNAKFIIEFDKREVKRYDGYAIYPIGQYKTVKRKDYEIKTGDILKVGDVLKHDYLVANIPYAKRTFKIQIDGIDNSTVKRTITSKVPTGIIVEEVLTKKGLNRIKAITQYTFNDRATPIKNDTISFDVYVQ